MHVTSDHDLFIREQELREEVSGAADALLRALQREHPEIVRHLQDKAIANRKDHP